MKNTRLFSLLLALGIGLALGAFLFGLPMLAGAQSPDTTFTYQGRLLRNGSYVDGVTCNFQFGLYSTLSGGTPMGTGTQTVSNVPVSDGYFTVNLDFGIVITGTPRYLETAVQCPGDTLFSTLSPRVTLHAAPYAQGVPWSGISGVPAGIGPYTAGTGLNLAANQFSITPTYRLPQTCANGQLARWNNTTRLWECVNDTTYTAGNGLNLVGNQFNVVTSTIQQRVGSPCAAGSSIRVINADGTVACEADDNTTYTAGAGIVIASNVISANFAGSGSANTVARSDHNHDAAYINVGEAAGGDLTGTYPSPGIASDVVGMAEISETMGSGTAGNIASTRVNGGENYLWPTTTVFTPTASGHCLVIVTVDVSSNGTEVRERAWVGVARRVGIISSIGNNLAYMASDSGHAHLGSTTVADIMPVTGGQSTQFGCYIDTTDSSWTDDEYWHCALAYLCQ